jgi:uncharacterized membrane protein required for colicin V production
VPALVAGPVATVLIFFAGAILTGIIGRFLLRLGHRSGVVHGSLDRGLGALAGAAMGGFGLWVVLSALAVVDVQFGGLDLRGSQFCAVAQEHNLFDHLESPAVTSLKRLVQAARNPIAVAQLRTDSEAQKLLDDPRIQSLVRGPDALIGESASGKLSPEALRVLADPAVVKRLEAILGKVPEVNR